MLEDTSELLSNIGGTRQSSPAILGGTRQSSPAMLGGQIRAPLQCWGRKSELPSNVEGDTSELPCSWLTSWLQSFSPAFLAHRSHFETQVTPIEMRTNPRLTSGELPAV